MIRCTPARCWDFLYEAGKYTWSHQGLSWRLFRARTWSSYCCYLCGNYCVKISFFAVGNYARPIGECKFRKKNWWQRESLSWWNRIMMGRHMCAQRTRTPWNVSRKELSFSYVHLTTTGRKSDEGCMCVVSSVHLTTVRKNDEGFVCVFFFHKYTSQQQKGMWWRFYVCVLISTLNNHRGIVRKVLCVHFTKYTERPRKGIVFRISCMRFITYPKQPQKSVTKNLSVLSACV